MHVDPAILSEQCGVSRETVFDKPCCARPRSHPGCAGPSRSALDRDTPDSVAQEGLTAILTRC